ncbi:hypothetical protein KEM44_20875 [Sinorhizobium meliloti]|uniref:hypothetical protein n=1 Tax=Rhizobium meliloti TaxID=382 RepID=UPI000B5A5D69|nr:hypothetical protein [Sinorhizobium meliloti]ASJ58942.1 hypothetical protein SMB554_06920 [Sinorhizobium meliloti]MCK3783531.1 hypothetical protein [Sinorhizobium meliloti]MCK3787839.1 hypothetical protein [Sinorhizobium meliloti]MCK3794884.1 hypothetical protein [Sinorhizobium meliloti]RVQ10781.1 hypothetical protein CN067_33100 [Sinorhizobium meliloti]
MTAPAAIKQSDLNRLANVAKANAMTIEVEVGGKLYRFIPGIHAPRLQEEETVDRGKNICL